MQKCLNTILNKLTATKSGELAIYATQKKQGRNLCLNICIENISIKMTQKTQKLKLITKKRVNIISKILKQCMQVHQTE